MPAILFKDNEKCSQSKDASKDESRGRMLKHNEFFVYLLFVCFYILSDS